ncbi:hypothetical protein B1B_01804 [mine drainage metagenome]|uniref:DUF3150 domain-containing protein n=1 Tax=mine drainage metagenome TaxID=410659 RepID=T1C5W0_9ZZZZ
MSKVGEAYVVTLASHIWDARVKLLAEDIGLRSEDIPVRAVAGLGSKYTYDRKVLSVLSSKRSMLHRMLRNIGVNLGGAFVVPADGYDGAKAKIQDVICEFEHELAKISSAVPTAYPAWRNEIPAQFRPDLTEGEIIQELSGCYLRVNAFHVMEVADREISRIAEKLVEEVAADAAEMLRSSFGRKPGRDEGTQRVLNPLRRLRDKVRSMSTLVDSVIWEPIVEAMDDLLAELPKAGPLDAAHMRRLYSFLIALSGVDSGRVQLALSKWGAEESEAISSGSGDGGFFRTSGSPAAEEEQTLQEEQTLAELANALGF